MFSVTHVQHIYQIYYIVQIEIIIKWFTVHLLPTGWVVQCIRCLPYEMGVPWFESSSGISFSISIIHTWRNCRHNLIHIKNIELWSYFFFCVDLKTHFIVFNYFYFHTFLRRNYFPVVNISQWKGYHITGKNSYLNATKSEIVTTYYFKKLCCKTIYAMRNCFRLHMFNLFIWYII